MPALGPSRHVGASARGGTEKYSAVREALAAERAAQKELNQMARRLRETEQREAKQAHIQRTKAAAAAMRMDMDARVGRDVTEAVRAVRVASEDEVKAVAEQMNRALGFLKEVAAPARPDPSLRATPSVPPSRPATPRRPAELRPTRSQSHPSAESSTCFPADYGSTGSIPCKLAALLSTPPPPPPPHLRRRATSGFTSSRPSTRTPLAASHTASSRQQCAACSTSHRPPLQIASCSRCGGLSTRTPRASSQLASLAGLCARASQAPPPPKSLTPRLGCAHVSAWDVITHVAPRHHLGCS